MSDLSCQELVELVTAYLEGTLSDIDRKRFELHLTECDGCTHYLAQMQRTIALIGKLSDESFPSSQREALLRAFRSWRMSPNTLLNQEEPQEPERPS